MVKKGYKMTKENKLIRSRKDLVDNTNKIIKLYKSGKSASELGIQFNTTHNSILSLLRRNNIKTRPQAFYILGEKNNRYNNIPKEEIISKYKNGSYISDLAIEYNCSISYIGNLLKKEGIKLIRPKQKEETKIKLSETKKRKIIEVPGYKEQCIKNLKGGLLGKHHKEKKKQMMRGDKNPMWNNGSSFEPYSPTFNKEFKNVVRLRDNFCCLNCGISEPKHIILLRRKLVIHHIDYDKKNTCLQNCVSLCNKCHQMTNLNREYWKNLFQEKLNKLYNYQYKNGNVIIKLEENENGKFTKL